MFINVYVWKCKCGYMGVYVRATNICMLVCAQVVVQSVRKILKYLLNDLDYKFRLFNFKSNYFV